jgi:holo-[acyl-carrier protein] synthase
MIIGIGIDITEVSRIKDSIDKYGQSFLSRIYTSSEIAYCESFSQNCIPHYTGFFSAKEAFSKALGTGIGQQCSFLSLEISHDMHGKPIIIINDSIQELIKDSQINVSISHTNHMAIAIVIISKDENIEPLLHTISQSFIGLSI